LAIQNQLFQDLSRIEIGTPSYTIQPGCWSFSNTYEKRSKAKKNISYDTSASRRKNPHSICRDDTILMVEGGDRSIINMKFILYYFEWLSGLKINYHKSETYFFGWKDKAKERIANMLNCKIGDLPMTYMGSHISGTKLGMGDLNVMVEKVLKRIPPWKGKEMSSSGRLILSNNYLSSLPTYTMSFYFLHLGTHRNMDSVRAKFFWRRARGILSTKNIEV
jgi:hypothetical protein